MAKIIFKDDLEVVHRIQTDLIWESRCDLKGNILTAGWIFSMPYNYFEGIYGDPRNDQDIHHENGYILTGMFQEIAETIEKQCNFIFNMTEIKHFGVRNEDGSWTGIMEMMRKNELDVAIADITPTEQRSKIADFSIGLRRSDFLLFQAMSKDNFNWEIYKNVFSDQFWICLMICIFTLTSCLSLIKFFTMSK